MTSPLFPDLVVNGERVPHAVVAAEVQHHSAPKGKPGLAWRKAATAVAVRTLLLQEARRRGLSARPAEVGPGRFETDEEALIRALLEAAVTPATPSEEAVREEWERDPSRFLSPTLWEVSHILIACDPRDRTGREAAQRLAEGLAARAGEAPGDFPRLAEEHSDCPSRSSGGKLGQIGPGDTVPEFEAALRKLGGGEVTAEPVLTGHGWHVIRMDAVAHGTPLPYEAVRGKIANALEKAAWTRAARTFIDRLAEGAVIVGADLFRGACGQDEGSRRC